MTRVRHNISSGSLPRSGIELAAANPPARSLAFLPRFEPGWVWLTGAGPGDPGLLTLQAYHALQDADVVYFDALISDDILRLIPNDTPRVFVGKRAGHPSLKQPEITSKLVQSARRGCRVLRLKGGDPFVFGRGAEEAIALGAAGVPFRILPGVTAGIGGLAYAGLAVTHRDYNQALTLITAHDALGGLSSALDWEAIARGSPVLVIYMGFRLLDEISMRLIAEGRAADEAVAVVSNASTGKQRTVVTTLENAAEEVNQAGLEPPAMIIVGEIVRLKASLDWAESAFTAIAETQQAAAGI